MSTIIHPDGPCECCAISYAPILIEFQTKSATDFKRGYGPYTTPDAFFCISSTNSNPCDNQHDNTSCSATADPCARFKKIVTTVAGCQFVTHNNIYTTEQCSDVLTYTTQFSGTGAFAPGDATTTCTGTISCHDSILGDHTIDCSPQPINTSYTTTGISEKMSDEDTIAMLMTRLETKAAAVDWPDAWNQGATPGCSRINACDHGYITLCRWRLIALAAPSTCYLKVWWRILEQRTLDGVAGDHPITVVNSGDWTYSQGGTPCLQNPNLAADDDANKPLSDTHEISLPDVDPHPGTVTRWVQITKYSVIPGYVPDDPIDFNLTRPNPDPRPSGYPA